MVLFRILLVFVRSAWLIWPTCILADLVISRWLGQSRPALRRLRWVPRIAQAFTAAVFVLLFGMEFFWLNIIGIHYHGGWERYVVSVVVFYVCLRLAQRFDRQPMQSGATRFKSDWLPAVTPAVAFLLATVAGYNSITSALTDRINSEFTAAALLIILTFVSLALLMRCPVQRWHIVFYVCLLGACLAVLISCWVATGGEFMGFLPWGRTTDNLWYLVLVAVASFATIVATAWARRRQFLASNHQDGV